MKRFIRPGLVLFAVLLLSMRLVTFWMYPVAVDGAGNPGRIIADDINYPYRFGLLVFYGFPIILLLSFLKKGAPKV